MTNLEFNSRVGEVMSRAEIELRVILLDAARVIASAESKATGTLDVVKLDMAELGKAVIDGFNGVVTLAGLHVGNISTLSAILTAIEKRLGDVQLIVPKAESIFAKVEGAVKAELNVVERDFKAVEDKLTHGAL